MKKIISVFVLAIFAACNPKPAEEKKAPEMKVKEESVAYSADSVNMQGFVAYNEADSSKRPVVMIVHEWWGLVDYPKERARQLAKLGYFAMAVDLFGDGKTASNPGEAQALVMPFYTNPQMAKARFDAALEKVKTYSQADPNNIAVIGYCFGGNVALNMARMGEDLKGAVSFHGSLLGVPPDKKTLKAEVLVCHGDADKFVSPEEVSQFTHQMDSIGAKYTLKHYANATHAFTNPASTENGKKFSMPVEYNAAADTASFNEMIAFFHRIF